MILGLFVTFFCILIMNFFVSLSRFLNCLIILENFNIILLLFSLMVGASDSHTMFIILMVVSTVEVVIGLVILTRVWECVGALDLVSF